MRKYIKHMKLAVFLVSLLWIVLIYKYVGIDFLSTLTVLTILKGVTGLLFTSVLFFGVLVLFDLIIIREIRGLLEDYKAGNSKLKIIIIISALLVLMRLLASAR